MKTIFTFLIGALVSFSALAENKTPNAYQPSVVINAPSNFEISVDGRSVQTNDGYNNNSVELRNLNRGQHSLEVYEMRNGLFGKSRKLVSSSKFNVDYNDVYIEVDRNGYANVQERNSGYTKNRQDNSGYDNRRRNNSGYGNNSRNRDDVYNNGNGRGYGYGRNNDRTNHDDCDDDHDYKNEKKNKKAKYNKKQKNDHHDHHDD